jgi:PiT family inorganic phosphate transporter
MLWEETGRSVHPTNLTPGSSLLLFCALALALAFEFVNGFHDTANAVATVIYTRSLKPAAAVVWSGMWNFLGVLQSSGTVAFAIVALLPVELILNVGTGAGFAMVFALLVSSMIWNLGTWFLGLPASSSHTLIGSILGVGLANSLLTPGQRFGEGVNWGNAAEVGLSLLISPIIGFCGAAGLLLVSRRAINRPELFMTPKKEEPPPLPVRLVLFLTCTGVSFAHGSNDGQKGMGLVMLILIGILPGTYALNPRADRSAFEDAAATAASLQPTFEQRGQGATVENAKAELSAFLKNSGRPGDRTFAALAAANRRLEEQFRNRDRAGDIRLLRTDIYLAAKTIGKLARLGQFPDPEVARQTMVYRQQLENLVNFIPGWVKAAIAVSLGLGTMVGWKRIVVTVGEKIGKAHLSYAQGAAAELVAMAAIATADRFGLPVSTTHVLSSGIAGSMAADRSGLRMDTVRNLCLAWVLTLPACVLLGAALFAGSLQVFLHVLGLK